MSTSPDSDSDEEPSTVGWDAIEAVLKSLYPDREPRHWGPILNYCLGGSDPLDGISAYLHVDGQSDRHWHYVSYGMSELYEKEGESAEISGWGFEFTFRLKCEPSEKEPPQWPLGLLQNLARYVFNSGNLFEAGHYLPLNGPIALDHETAIHAAMFAEDPELGEIETPNGSLQFLQVVGTTLDELAAVQGWNASSFLDVLKKKNPLLITDLARHSILQDPEVAKAIEKGTALDGSSTASLFVRELEVNESSERLGPTSLTLQFGASGVAGIKALLRGRIPFGKDLTLAGPNASVKFSVSDEFGWTTNAENSTSITLPGDATQSLADVLQPKRGTYEIAELPNLTVRIVPSKIMDHTGKTVIETIG